MSLNKTSDQLLGPKCSRCSYHGIIVRVKGHRKQCPFLQCRCWKCELVQQRSRITAVERRISDQSRGQRPNLGMIAAAPSTDKDDVQARVARHIPVEAPETVATGDCCPLDLRTRPPAGRGAVTAAGCQALPQVQKGGMQIPNGTKFGPRFPVGDVPWYAPYPQAPLRVPCVAVYQVAPRYLAPPPPQHGPDAAEA